MKETIGFVPEERERMIDIDDYKGLWVVIDRRHSGGLAGRLSDVFKDRVLLMPYQTLVFLDGRQKYEIVRDGLPHLIERIDICGIRETSEENVQGYCDYSNSKLQKEE